ncbi:semaphorin-4F [Thalassophryne amazonica]|uniref:semaphorin-4F n=1 Tax=Thalassophryne amazonica TaxID=390379 RepID=UPI001471B73C|nr:semaphorin-4F [Thalassophryne amazonica]
MTPSAATILLLVWCLHAGASSAASLRAPGDAILGPEDLEGVTNFSTFLLNRMSGVLYLGARDAILAVDTNKVKERPLKIKWDVPKDKKTLCMGKGKSEEDCNNYIRLLEFLGDDRIYVCGTYAFDPQCAFLELPSFTLEETENGGIKLETGKGKCPFEPMQHFTAVMADGTLYTAATSNFLGTQFDISRATGPEQERIRTEQSINWLSDPEFVSSAFIKQSPTNNPTGDDDKIYFFFTEVVRENDLYTKVQISRVARVCKSDVGGLKTLQRRWTTFLKAQLVCEDKPSGQRYNILTDVFTVQHTPEDPSSTHFYGLFMSQWEREAVSAVCVFSLSDISVVMDGPFKELKKNCDSWINPEPVPAPRPGQCLNNALKADGCDSSLKLPDKVLTFVRDHPLMENSVATAPLLVRQGITYTKLAVTRSGSGKARKGTVLHLGTDRGELHRVAVVDQRATLLQELSLFTAQEPVNNILLYKGWALVGSPRSLARVQAEGCAVYNSCKVCAAASGLGCVWSNAEKTCTATEAEPDSGDTVDAALKKCNIYEGRCSPSITEIQVSSGLHLVLPCVQLSSMPCSWDHPPHRHTRQHHSDLHLTVSEETVGKYICTCQEAWPGKRDPVPCRRAFYQLTLEGPIAGGSFARAGGRDRVATYILTFCAGVLLSVFVMFYINRRCSLGHQGHRLPDNSQSSEKGRELLGSSATPQSPISTSLLSDGFQLMEKHNGTSTTSTTLHSIQGNGGHHGNSYNLIHCNPSNGHGNVLHTSSTCNRSSTELDFTKDIFAGDGRTEERVRGMQEREDRELGDDVGDGLRDGLGDSVKRLEELSRFQAYSSPAPLAKCEESSI